MFGVGRPIPFSLVYKQREYERVAEPHATFGDIKVWD